MADNVTDLDQARQRRRILRQGPGSEMPETLLVIEDWSKEWGPEWVGAPDIELMPPDFPPIDGDVIGIYKLVGTKRVSVTTELKEID